MHTIRIAQMGLGPLGIKIVNLINERKGVKVTRAVDCDPRLTGQDLGVICGGKPNGNKCGGAECSTLCQGNSEARYCGLQAYCYGGSLGPSGNV